MNVSTVLLLRFVLAAPLMVVVLLVTGQRLPRGAVLLQLVGMGALGYVGQSFAFLSALEYASAGLVTLLLYLYPTFVAALSPSYSYVSRSHESWCCRPWLLLSVRCSSLVPKGGEVAGILLAIAAV